MTLDSHMDSIISSLNLIESNIYSKFMHLMNKIITLKTMPDYQKMFTIPYNMYLKTFDLIETKIPTQHMSLKNDETLSLTFSRFLAYKINQNVITKINFIGPQKLLWMSIYAYLVLDDTISSTSQIGLVAYYNKERRDFMVIFL
jgi:hypothetical protein